MYDLLLRTPFRLLLLVILTVGAPLPEASAQTFDRLTRPMVTLTEREVIQTLLAEMLILPPDTLSSLSLIDISANGFGPDDVILLNPTSEVHFVGELVPAALRTLVTGWRVASDFRVESTPEDVAPALIQAHLNQDAASAMATTCLNAIEEHYEGDDLSLLLTRKRGTVRLEMWGYDAQALRYGGAGGAAACEVNRQRFEFARPITITAFKEPSSCVETWAENGRVVSTPCPQN